MRTYPSKHAGSDPETFWLRPVMAITASVQPEWGRIIYALSDCPLQIQFRFSKEGMDHNVQDRPGSDTDGCSRLWPNASGLEASRCAGQFLAGRNQPATSFPLSDSVLPQTSRISPSPTNQPHIVQNQPHTAQNQPGFDLVLVDCVRF